MNNRLLAIIFVLATGFGLVARADEGMWLPVLLNQKNITAMQNMGLKLTPEQIYSVNQACLKDAIVALDHGGCTGSIISANGLLITNHHCGFEAIAGQSTVEHDYLTDGFWAMRQEEELPIPGKTVSFLILMKDVTSEVLSGIEDESDKSSRAERVERVIDSLKKVYEEVSGYEISIESMLHGNSYYMFEYQTFNDVRLVGAPPSGVGKFGGETDNWMWPRHTGDFCLLRVYSGADGKPAEKSDLNIPLNPKYFLPVSLEGVKEGDFSMIMGYPGSTDRYLTSYGIEHKLEVLNPTDILLKTAKMEILKKYMNQSDALRLAYASDYAYLANFQKKSIQESKALKRLKVYDDKKQLEDSFQEWVSMSLDRADKYGSVLNDMEEVYKERTADKADKAQTYLEETLMGVKILLWAYQTNELLSSLEDGNDLTEQLAHFRKQAAEFYREFNQDADKEIMCRMFKLYRENLPDQYYPDLFVKISKKFDNSDEKFADALYRKSIFASAEAFEAFLNKPTAKKLSGDPAFEAANSFLASYILAMVTQMGYQEKFDEASRLFVAGLMEQDTNRNFYPDANSTLRLTYGQVKAYDPADAVEYMYRTTSKGILEKDDPQNREFAVPEKLKILLKAGDFGKYGENGILPVCFLTTHDITGGNSGSPVINGRGELIAVAFDGNSEAMSSDIKYDVNLQRTICVDIRYVLFIVDKYAGAGYLLDELKFAGK